MGNGGLGKLVCIYKLIYKIMISSVCKETHWKCPSDDECIYKNRVCDGSQTLGCKMGEDEADCPTCKEGEQLILPEDGGKFCSLNTKGCSFEPDRFGNDIQGNKEYIKR